MVAKKEGILRYMGLFNLLGKKTTKTSGTKPLKDQPLTNKDNQNTKFEMLIFEKSLLIWFSSGPNKNYAISNDSKSFGDFTLYFRHSEPSAIDIYLPISNNTADPDESIMYWPSYDQLSPSQRKAYLDWLNTGAREKISIGYVFLYYYGLERWLFSEKWEQAFNETLRITTIYPKIKAYCRRPLTFVAIINDRIDLLKILEEKECLDYVTRSFLDIRKLGYITAESFFGSINQAVLPINKNYFNNNYQLYKETFDKLIIEYDNRLNVDHGDLSECLKSEIFANKSMHDDVSPSELPNVYTSESIKEKASLILNKVHETVKEELRKIRKANPVKRNNTTTTEFSKEIKFSSNHLKTDFTGLYLKSVEHGRLYPLMDLSMNLEYSLVRSTDQPGRVKKAYSAIENRTLIDLIEKEIDSSANINSRGFEEVLSIWGEALLAKGYKHEAVEIVKILFSLPSAYCKFVSTHFLLNNLMNAFYPSAKNNIESREICYLIGEMDFVLTCSYDFFNSANLPCITKLVQLLENDSRYDEALSIISIYENKDAVREIKELLPKKKRILSKL